MRFDDPRLISECRKIAEQRIWDVSSFADFILQTYGTGIKFAQVYGSAEPNSWIRFYNLDDIVAAEERGEIEFVKGNDHLDHSCGADWCLQFTNGQTIQPVSYQDIMKSIDPGVDPENIICEGKFRNAALALATLAGLSGGNYALAADKCTPPQYIEEPTPDAKYNNMKGITKAKSNWRRHRIDYMDDNDDILYSMGKGNLSSRAHNPGNLVVNDMDSAKKIGAIGYYQADKGNKYAVFPDDATGHTALENWWFTGNNANMTVNQLLSKLKLVVVARYLAALLQSLYVMNLKHNIICI